MLQLDEYRTKNARVRAWVAEMVALCKPEKVHWCEDRKSTRLNSSH